MHLWEQVNEINILWGAFRYKIWPFILSFDIEIHKNGNVPIFLASIASMPKCPMMTTDLNALNV